MKCTPLSDAQLILPCACFVCKKQGWAIDVENGVVLCMDCIHDVTAVLVKSGNGPDRIDVALAIEGRI